MFFMVDNFKNLKKLSLLGAALLISSCSPEPGSKVYPYNYDPKNPQYLIVVEDGNFEGLSAEEKFLISQENGDISFEDMDQTREIDGEDLFAPMGGMVLTPLFTDPVRSDTERFLRLESVVQTLRNDVDVLIPKVFQIPEIKQVEPDAPKPPLVIKNESAPVDLGAAASEVKKVYEVVARDFRRADHKDKTRIVIDLSAEKNINAVMSGDGRKLIIDLKGISWRPSKEWNALSGDLISGYKLEKDDKLFVDLMYKSEIAKKMLMKPNQDSKNYRLVIDLVSPHLHKK